MVCGDVALAWVVRIRHTFCHGSLLNAQYAFLISQKAAATFTRRFLNTTPLGVVTGESNFVAIIEFVKQNVVPFDRFLGSDSSQMIRLSKSRAGYRDAGWALEYIWSAR